MVRDLVDLGVEDTLQYDPFEDESQNSITFHTLDEDPHVTPAWGGSM